MARIATRGAGAAGGPGRTALVKEILLQSVADAFTDRFPQWAAAVAFNAVMSIFPLLLAGVAVAAWFVEPHWAVHQTHEMLSVVLPHASGFVEQTVHAVIDARGRIGVVSLVVLLFFGSQVFSSLTVALNVAFDDVEPDRFLKRLAIQLFMTITVGGLFVLAAVTNTASAWLPAIARLSWIDAALAELATLGLVLAGFFFIYRFVPSGKHDWRASVAGAVVATTLFRIARPLFAYYVDRFTNYNLIYGSVAIVFLLLLWVWIVSLVTLFGGELASHVQMMAIDGQTRDDIRRRHEARSVDRRHELPP